MGIKKLELNPNFLHGPSFNLKCMPICFELTIWKCVLAVRDRFSCSFGEIRKISGGGGASATVCFGSWHSIPILVNGLVILINCTFGGECKHFWGGAKRLWKGAKIFWLMCTPAPHPPKNPSGLISMPRIQMYYHHTEYLHPDMYSLLQGYKKRAIWF